MDNSLYELESAPIGRLLWKYSIPAIVGIVVMSLYNVIDRIFIGQGVGPDAIAGLAVTFPVMNLTTALGVLIGGGAAARISIVLGQNDKHRAFLILGNSLVMTLIFGAAYLSVFAIFIDDILLAFGASERTLPYARDFMLYIMPGLLATNLCFSFNNIMRASGYPTKAMVTMFIGAGVNVSLAPIFIFGLGWGIKGAAIATDIAMTISMIFVMAHFTSTKSRIHFKHGIYRLSPQILMAIMSIGAAPFFVNVAGCVINAIVNNSLYRYGGDSAVAAMGIFTTFTQLLVMVVIGICQGMQPIVGYNFGARRYDRLKRAYWLSVAAASVICTLGTVLCHLCPELIARAFTTDAALISSTALSLRITTTMFWMAGFQIVSTNFFQSLGYAGKSIFMSLTRQVLFIIPMLIILPPHFGLNGVWAAFPTADTLSTFVTIVLVISQFRQIHRLQHTTQGAPS
ncbi:MAG: MATE family efflux transporter [Bacteroidales bacterium]|nr:MATE family efflux transporter [Bacteroidales bacterium]